MQESRFLRGFTETAVLPIEFSNQQGQGLLRSRFSSKAMGMKVSDLRSKAPKATAYKFHYSEKNSLFTEKMLPTTMYNKYIYTSVHTLLLGKRIIYI